MTLEILARFKLQYKCQKVLLRFKLQIFFTRFKPQNSLEFSKLCNVITMMYLAPKAWPDYSVRRRSLVSSFPDWTHVVSLVTEAQEELMNNEEEKKLYIECIATDIERMKKKTMMMMKRRRHCPRLLLIFEPQNKSQKFA